MQPSQPTAVTSVTIATMSDANYCKYCNYVGFVTTCNYCEYFANGGIHGVASLPAAFWNAGFTNTHVSRLPTIGPSVAIPNQSKSLIMVGCASSQHGFLRRLCILIVRGGTTRTRQLGMQCNVFSTFWHDMFVGGWRAQPLQIGRGPAPRSTHLDIILIRE